MLVLIETMLVNTDDDDDDDDDDHDDDQWIKMRREEMSQKKGRKAEEKRSEETIKTEWRTEARIGDTGVAWNGGGMTEREEWSEHD